MHVLAIRLPLIISSYSTPHKVLQARWQNAEVNVLTGSQPRGIPGAIAPGGGQSWRMGLASEERPNSSMGSSSMVCHA